VPARLCDGRLRDHLRGGADRGAGVARDARRRSGLARHHDGDEPADLLHAPAARADAVLFARRGAARNHHAAHLRRHYSVRADPAVRADRAMVRAGPRDRAAARAVRALRRAQAGQNRSAAIQSQTIPASSSDRKIAAEPMSLTRFKARSWSRLTRSLSFSIAVLSNSTIMITTSVPISATRLPASAVRKKASGTPIASTTSSSRNACSDCAAATSPFQLLRVARQSRFTSSPAQRHKLRGLILPVYSYRCAGCV